MSKLKCIGFCIFISRILLLSFVTSFSNNNNYAHYSHNYKTIHSREQLSSSRYSSSLLHSLKLDITDNKIRSINTKKKSKTKNVESTPTTNLIDITKPPNRDEMIARAAILRQSILKQQLELQKLERAISCCSSTSSSSTAFFSFMNSNTQSPTTTTNGKIIDELLDNDPIEVLFRTADQAKTTFLYSLDVLKRKLNRVKTQRGKNNLKYKSEVEYLSEQTITGVRIVKGLVESPNSLLHLADPSTPTLIAHLPAIYARLDKLEIHVKPILEKVLNNKKHLASIEPYLDLILDRFDDIEPHLPWILKNIDTLAPYTGLLLRHIDELLLYAQPEDDDDLTNAETRYQLAEQVLPYLEFYVSRLDIVGPHLPLLRPHLKLLLKHNRIAKVTPHIDKLFARGYLNLGTSANLDVLLFWVGWTLRVPLLPRIFFGFPGSPRFVSFLANRLPKRFVRGYCSGITCSIENDYGSSWNRLAKD